MKKEGIIGLVIGALVASVVGLLVTRTADDIEAGSDALTTQQIEAVVTEALNAYGETQTTVIGGETKTFGEALAIISTEQAVMKEALRTLAEE